MRHATYSPMKDFVIFFFYIGNKAASLCGIFLLSPLKCALVKLNCITLIIFTILGLHKDPWRGPQELLSSISKKFIIYN